MFEVTGANLTGVKLWSYLFVQEVLMGSSSKVHEIHGMLPDNVVRLDTYIGRTCTAVASLTKEYMSTAKTGLVRDWWL